MRHSSLASFLNGERSPDKFWREIEPEVTECLPACDRGSSGHVIITDGPGTMIGREQVAVLLTALVEAKLPLQAASYVADALIMSDDYEWEDDAVSEALFFLSDESALLTVAEIEAARSRLAGAL